jgi:hypothetical protein
MANQTKDHSQTTAITLTQLAAIAGRDPSFFSLHKDELPEPVPIYDGTHGRPQLAYSIEALAELIVERVGHLDESIVRLRLALSGHRPPVEKDRARMQSLKLPSPIRLIEDAQGNYVVIPECFGELPPELTAKVRALITQEHASTRARRSANRSRRITRTTPQETQP